MAQYITTKEAINIISDNGVGPISLPTMITWAKKHKIGKKVGGRWQIDRKKLEEYIQKGNS